MQSLNPLYSSWRSWDVAAPSKLYGSILGMVFLVRMVSVFPTWCGWGMHFFFFHLLWRGHWTSFWISLRGNWFMQNGSFKVSVWGGEFRRIPCHHIELEPPLLFKSDNNLEEWLVIAYPVFILFVFPRKWTQFYFGYNSGQVWQNV